MTIAVSVLAMVLSGSEARALCIDPCWSAAGSLAGEARALLEYTNSRGQYLYAAGQDFATGRIARWRGGPSWEAVGGGIGEPGEVANALAEFDDGGGLALYVAGNFTTAGGAAASGIARLDGAIWSPVGGGVTTLGDGVLAMAVFDDGSGPALYLAGTFTTSGGEASNLAKWDGVSWSAVGNGPAAWALQVFDDGSGAALYAAGEFSSAGGTPANSVAKWDGASWSALGAGLALSGGGTSRVRALAVYDDGGGSALYAGGDFGLSGATPLGFVARWDGVSWSEVGPGTSWTGSSVHALLDFDDGSGPLLYAGGDFAITLPMLSATEIASFDGLSWTRAGTISEVASGGVQGMASFRDPEDVVDPTVFASGAFVIDAQPQAVVRIVPQPGAGASYAAALLSLCLLARRRQRSL